MEILFLGWLKTPSNVNFLGTDCKYGYQVTVSQARSQEPFPSTRFQARIRLAGKGSQVSVPRKSWFPSKISRNNWEPLLANLFLGTLLQNLFLATYLAWEPFPGNIAWELFPATLLVNLFLGNLFGNLILGTCYLGTLLGNVLGNLTCDPVLGNLVWAPVPGNLWLGTLLGNLFLKILLGNQLAGNLALTPLP